MSPAAAAAAAAAAKSLQSCPTLCDRAIAVISHTSKVMLKILQARLQPCMNHELPDVQAGFRKGRGTRDQIANIRRMIEKEKARGCGGNCNLQDLYF